MGYHLAEIKKGVYGEISKIQEELDELNDAVNQGNKIMELVELSDIIGAIKGFLKTYYPDFNLTDLIVMMEATERAFNDGSRRPD